MSKIKALVFAATLAITALAAPTSPAQADSGNNNWTCDTYEICFNGLSHTSWNTSYGISHMFYYGNMHHDMEAICTEPGGISCILLMDHAVGFWNRDSSCSVTLWDVTGSGTWYSYGTFARGYRGDVGGDRNNGHSRC